MLDGLDVTLKGMAELTELLGEVSQMNIQAADLTAAGTLAKSVNRCAKAGPRLFNLAGNGTVDQLHDAALGLIRQSR